MCLLYPTSPYKQVACRAQLQGLQMRQALRSDTQVLDRPSTIKKRHLHIKIYPSNVATTRYQDERNLDIIGISSLLLLV